MSEDTYHDIQFERMCRVAQISKKTQYEYGSKALRVMQETGMSLSFESLRRYIRTHTHLAASTLRGVKSAVLFVMELSDRPMKAADARRLDMILDGLECQRESPSGFEGPPHLSRLTIWSSLPSMQASLRPRLP